VTESGSVALPAAPAGTSRRTGWAVLGVWLLALAAIGLVTLLHAALAGADTPGYEAEGAVFLAALALLGAWLVVRYRR
jgi:hypothetical protein